VRKRIGKERDNVNNYLATLTDANKSVYGDGTPVIANGCASFLGGSR
jgi:hypothetical protein